MLLWQPLPLVQPAKKELDGTVDMFGGSYVLGKRWLSAYRAADAGPIYGLRAIQRAAEDATSDSPSDQWAVRAYSDPMRFHNDWLEDYVQHTEV
eukprot:SAG31_NODE_1349_length_8691_cov_6.407239_2_plen_94_part_00